jgi:hypothetical protein
VLEMYRARIAFQSLDGDHVFYSTLKGSRAEVRSMLNEMKYVVGHAVSVKIQKRITTSRDTTIWETDSTLDPPE